jgi:hypothetical protein
MKKATKQRNGQPCTIASTLVPQTMSFSLSSSSCFLVVQTNWFSLQNDAM